MFPSIFNLNVPNTLFVCKWQVTLQNNIISVYDEDYIHFWNRKRKPK